MSGISRSVPCPLEAALTPHSLFQTLEVISFYIPAGEAHTQVLQLDKHGSMRDSPEHLF